MKKEEYMCDLLGDVYKQAFKFEKNHGFCPQAVLITLQKYFNFIDNEAIKAVHALAGGGALCGEGTCGGLVGGIVVISNKFGRSKEDIGQLSKNESLKSCKVARKLHMRFVNEFGSVICKDIQEKKMGRSFDMWDPVDYQNFIKAGAHNDKCPDVTGKVAKWTAQILIEEGATLKTRN